MKIDSGRISGYIRALTMGRIEGANEASDQKRIFCNKISNIISGSTNEIASATLEPIYVKMLNDISFIFYKSQLVTDLGKDEGLEVFLRNTTNQKLIMQSLKYRAEDNAFFAGIQDPEGEVLVSHMPSVDKIIYETVVKKNPQLQIRQKDRLWSLYTAYRSLEENVTPKALKMFPLRDGAKDSILNLDYVTLSGIIKLGVSINSSDELLKLVQSLGLETMNKSEKDKDSNTVFDGAAKRIQGLQVEDVEKKLRDIRDDRERE